MDEELKYSYEGHSPIAHKGIPWRVCKYCGLVYLNNSFTKWAIKMGCNNEIHPQYAEKKKEFTGKNVETC